MAKILNKGQGPTGRAVGADGGRLDIFSLVIYHFSFLSPSLWKTDRNRLQYCLKGPLKSKPTNQPTLNVHLIKFSHNMYALNTSYRSYGWSTGEQGLVVYWDLEPSIDCLFFLVFI